MPLQGTFEICVTLLVLIAFWSLPYTQAVGGNLRLEFIFQRFSLRGQAILDIFSIFIGLVLFSLITWQAWNWTYSALQTKEQMEGAMGIPYFPSRLGLTIGTFFLCIQYVLDLWRRINQLLDKDRIQNKGKK
jgi:TRAP-type C4-dicarboxylate transport system permease small subunit